MSTESAGGTEGTEGTAGAPGADTQGTDPQGTDPQGADPQGADTDWKTDLRRRGYRLTPQRQLVLEAVDSLEHASPDEILAQVRKTASGVNISTVYRTLELLEELGLVSHAHLGHGAPTYHLADRHHHIHLVCRDCTGVIEADVDIAAEFTAKLRTTFGFETDMKHFAIFGLCKKCAAQHRAAQG